MSVKKKKSLGLGMKDLLKITFEHNSPEDAIYKEGVKLLKDGQLIKALEKFSAVLYFNSDHIKALNNSAVIFFELGLSKYAKEKFNKVLTLDSKNTTAIENLSAIMQMTGDKND